MNKNEKVVNMNVTVKDLFVKWIEFTRPFHKLNPQQSKVLALLLFHHHKLSKEITNNKILWKQVFDYETKIIICEQMDVTMGSLENLFSQLRKKKVIVDNKIINYFIPEFDNKIKLFKLTFNFKIINDKV